LISLSLSQDKWTHQTKSEKNTSLNRPNPQSQAKATIRQAMTHKNNYSNRKNRMAPKKKKKEKKLKS